MPDWKAMYLTLMRGTERAIRILSEAQQTCEDLYIKDEPPSLVLLSPKKPQKEPEATEPEKNF